MCVALQLREFSQKYRLNVEIICAHTIGDVAAVRTAIHKLGRAPWRASIMHEHAGRAPNARQCTEGGVHEHAVKTFPTPAAMTQIQVVSGQRRVCTAVSAITSAPVSPARHI
eukprot:jgi/Ulvmu1/8117/UM040_0012.1